MDSILNSVKKLLGITEDYTHFDPDLIMHINSAFFILNQLGVGPETPFTIEDKNDTWDDFVTDKDTEAIKSYIALRVRLLFDPPSHGSLMSAIQEQIKEYEWRLNVQVDPGKE